MIKYFLPYGLILYWRKKKKVKNVKARYQAGMTINGKHTFVYPDYASFEFTYDEIFKKKIYDFESNTIQPVIIDGGANIGLASIFWKEKFPEAKIIAVEADPKIADFLKQNFTANNLSDIEIIEKALWSDEKGVDFNSEGADSGLVKAGATCKIKSITLSKLLLNEEKIDFLKLDIEGAEYEVLKESRDCLDKVDKIFVEYHSFLESDQYLAEILKILTDNNFRYHINAPGLSSSKPFKKINTYLGMDMQLNIYAWKI